TSLVPGARRPASLGRLRFRERGPRTCESLPPSGSPPPVCQDIPCIRIRGHSSRLRRAPQPAGTQPSGWGKVTGTGNGGGKARRSPFALTVHKGSDHTAKGDSRGAGSLLAEAGKEGERT